MRRIDLTCLILSPIGVGFLMTYAGARAAILAILAWNLLAWAPECLLAAHAVRCSDALQCAQPLPGGVCMRGSGELCWHVCCNALLLSRHEMSFSRWQEGLVTLPAARAAGLLPEPGTEVIARGSSGRGSVGHHHRDDGGLVLNLHVTSCSGRHMRGSPLCLQLLRSLCCTAP